MEERGVGREGAPRPRSKTRAGNSKDQPLHNGGDGCDLADMRSSPSRCSGQAVPDPYRLTPMLQAADYWATFRVAVRCRSLAEEPTCTLYSPGSWAKAFFCTSKIERHRGLSG